MRHRPHPRPPRLLPALAVLLAVGALPACETKDPCDGIDNDGDGYVDEDLEAGEEIRPWFPDADGDGFGDLDFILAPPTWACAAPEGNVNNNYDCDDTDPSVNPDAAESCNERDDDCDGVVDDGVGDTYYTDGDGDGFGDLTSPELSCEPATGLVENADDCDDTSADIYPDAPELCDGLDGDCDGEIPADEEDGDGDGHIACADCDDSDPAVHPGAFEICDGIDANCDGAVDDADGDGGGTADCDEALVVVSWSFGQVQDLCPSTLDVLPDMETLALVEALADVGLSARVVIEDELEGVPADELEEHPAVVVLNGGLPWGAGFFNDTLPALDKAVGEGIPLWVIGDDAGDQIDDSALMPGLFGLEGFLSSGGPGAVEIAVLDHPVLDGPWGTVGSFDVDVDMDQLAAADTATVLLTQADGGHPALITHEPQDGAPVVVQLFGLASAGDTCPVAATDDPATLARNTLDWLLP